MALEQLPSPAFDDFDLLLRHESRCHILRRWTWSRSHVHGVGAEDVTVTTGTDQEPSPAASEQRPWPTAPGTEQESLMAAPGYGR